MSSREEGKQLETRESPRGYKAAERVREERRKRFLTIGELADAAGVHHQTLWRIENGYETKGATVKKIAKALGVEPSELVA